MSLKEGNTTNATAISMVAFLNQAEALVSSLPVNYQSQIKFRIDGLIRSLQNLPDAPAPSPVASAAAVKTGCKGCGARTGTLR